MTHLFKDEEWIQFLNGVLLENLYRLSRHIQNNKEKLGDLYLPFLESNCFLRNTICSSVIFIDEPITATLEKSKHYPRSELTGTMRNMIVHWNDEYCALFDKVTDMIGAPSSD